MDFKNADRVLEKYLGPSTRAIEAQRVLSDDEKLGLWERARSNPAVMLKAVEKLGPQQARAWGMAMENLRRLRGA